MALLPGAAPAGRERRTRRRELRERDDARRSPALRVGVDQARERGAHRVVLVAVAAARVEIALLGEGGDGGGDAAEQGGLEAEVVGRVQAADVASEGAVLRLDAHDLRGDLREPGLPLLGELFDG